MCPGTARQPALLVPNACSHPFRTEPFVAGLYSPASLPGGVIGNSPGSGPGIQGSSPCPAALAQPPPELRGGLLHPVAVQAPVGALRLEQLVVGSLLDDLAVFEHDDPAGLADRRQAVGDDDRRAACEQAPQAVLDLALG